MVEVLRHPNIEVLSYSEVARVEGTAGDFRVTVTRKPRYIDEDVCTGCGTCVKYCPKPSPDRFNQGIADGKAIHIYFSQAIPLVTYIDENCLELTDGKCDICRGVCQNKAIDFNQTAKNVELKVGAIILASGIVPFDPGPQPRNVITSLDYERLLSATGPYQGRILRPSDQKHPKRIAWIQCVGSRKIHENSYCSAVCCAYTQKQVILTKDHEPDAECTVFHNDIRAMGKDFERYYRRAADLPGVRFIRFTPSIAGERSGNVVLRYGATEEEFDLVVLAVGLTRAKLTADGPGIYATGGIHDIPEAVFGASAAAARCGEQLAYRRGRLATPRVYPPERDVSGSKPRIGVFVCHCGENIASVVNVRELVDYARRLPNVIHAQQQLFSCANNSMKEISELAATKGLNRVVIAACSPRTLESLFRDTLREAGLNPYFCEMANIREQCSWVHRKQKEEATRKAKDIVRMSVARAAHLEPLKEFDLPVHKTTLVVGGGIAGMTAALSLARQGFPVHLVEKETELGGMARRIPTTLEGTDVQALVRDLIRDVHRNPRIRVTHGAIRSVAGYVGNFTTVVGTESIRHGAAIIATGADEYRPTEYLFGKDPRVVTHLELGERLASGKVQARQVVMIQCVGCRNEERNYCSRVCCSHAIKNALKLRTLGASVTILYRDMRTYGLKEDYYREAADRGVVFVRYEEPPEVEPGLKIRVVDPVLGCRLELDADLLSLAAAVIPSADTERIANLFKLPLSPDGFFKEAHVKLRPVEFSTEGVYLCGSAHYPKHIEETIKQAYGAAGRAMTLLAHDTVAASGSVCEVNEPACVSCGACITACTYGAIAFAGTRARVNPVLCKGDGLCSAKCPTSAIKMKHFTQESLLAQIGARE